MTNLFNATLEWLVALSPFEWVGLICILIIIYRAISYWVKRKVLTIDGCKCHPFQKSKIWKPFICVTKDVKKLLPGECTPIGTTGRYVGRTSVEKGDKTNNTWGYWEES